MFACEMPPCMDIFTIEQVFRFTVRLWKAEMSSPCKQVYYMKANAFNLRFVALEYQITQPKLMENFNMFHQALNYGYSL